MVRFIALYEDVLRESPIATRRIHKTHSVTITRLFWATHRLFGQLAIHGQSRGELGRVAMRREWNCPDFDFQIAARLARSVSWWRRRAIKVVDDEVDRSGDTVLPQACNERLFGCAHFVGCAARNTNFPLRMRSTTRTEGRLCAQRFLLNLLHDCAAGSEDQRSTCKEHPHCNTSRPEGN